MPAATNTEEPVVPVVCQLLDPCASWAPAADDPAGLVWHRDGIIWHQAPISGGWPSHRHRVHSIIPEHPGGFGRCACGAATGDLGRTWHPHQPQPGTLAFLGLLLVLALPATALTLAGAWVLHQHTRLAPWPEELLGGLVGLLAGSAALVLAHWWTPTVHDRRHGTG